MENQQARRMTNNIKEKVRNPYSSNSYRNDDIEFCNESKVYYYVIIQECD